MRREEYMKNIEMDRFANGYTRKFPLPFYDYIWMYLTLLRRYEYYASNRGILNKFVALITKMRLRQYSVKTGISVPPFTFGVLNIWHYGSIVANGNIKCGKFITLQSATNISSGVTLGDNVYLAPGAKVLENVTIADGCIIGANAVVTKDIFLEPYTTWAGVPAKK